MSESEEFRLDWRRSQGNWKLVCILRHRLVNETKQYAPKVCGVEAGKTSWSFSLKKIYFDSFVFLIFDQREKKVTSKEKTSIMPWWSESEDSPSPTGWRVKAESSGEDPMATEGLVCSLPHPRVNKTKQHAPKVEVEAGWTWSGGQRKVKSSG